MPAKRPPDLTRFAYPKSVETRYLRALGDIFLDWIHFPPGIASIDALYRRMNATGNYAPVQVADRLARGMVTTVANVNAQHWRIASLRSTQGNRIFRLLQTELRGPVGVTIARQVRDNAKLIKTIPASITQDVTRHIDAQQRQGVRPETIARALSARMPGIAQFKLDRIARTEVAKANEAITQARADVLGLRWYQWLTAEDARVRLSHRNMDKVLVPYAAPPSPEALVRERSVGEYNAGNIWNCRCTAAVVVDLDEIAWPARVYWSGRIQRMTRTSFAKIAAAQVER